MRQFNRAFRDRDFNNMIHQADIEGRTDISYQTLVCHDGERPFNIVDNIEKCFAATKMDISPGSGKRHIQARVSVDQHFRTIGQVHGFLGTNRRLIVLQNGRR